MTDIALALSGGGFRGVAHLGVIDKLREYGFSIRAISGTSIGGLVGGLVAAGISTSNILNAIQQLDKRTVFARTSGDGPSLIGTKGIRKELSDLIGERTFADLQIPFACTAVDIHSSREVYLHEGSVLSAMNATMAIPGIFPPIVSEDMLLVDGGLLDPVPVQLARKIAPGLPVIAVALYPGVEAWEEHSKAPIFTSASLPIRVPDVIIERMSKMRLAQTLQLFNKSVDIGSMMLGELRLALDKPEVILRPNVSQVGMLDLVDPLHLVEAGRKTVDEEIETLQRAVSWKGKAGQMLRRIMPIQEPDIVRKSKPDANEDAHAPQD